MLYVKVYEFFIQEDKVEQYFNIQNRAVELYKKHLNCEVMYLQCTTDKTKWMEFSKYVSEENYKEGLSKINIEPEIQSLFKQFESCLLPENQKIEEYNYYLRMEK
ncbi:hypothetical protein P4U44_18975 [Alkalihalobacillus alcalophilus]|uniref:hypothetical protein n=1 Tax=Alkalihalobacillus alcalophilus TaxID=1445 RepID=UPI0010A5EB96|nr:hypothetical protein [Alkalihalobacillus alcalophilus]MED1563952.1 hypothetical protein [Alkalihalobacillus alcalophilus]